MTELPILRDLGLMVLAAAAALALVRRIGVPTIVGYLAAGLVLGPLIGLIAATESVELVSEVGIALLLFLVGLEFDLDRIGDVGRAVLLAGGVQLLLTAGAGYAIAAALGFDGVEPLLLGLAVAFSSTVVVVKLIERRGAIATLYGRLAIGILLVQDVVVAVALTLLAGLDASGTLAAVDVFVGLVVAFAGMAGLVVIAVLGARHLLPPAFRWLGGAVEPLFIWALAWCFLFIVGAQRLGLSVEIGAFVAGISLARLPFADNLVRRVQPLVNFFLAVFFVSLGIELELGAALERWPAALALGGLVLLGKPVLLMAVLPRIGYDEWTSFRTSLSLGQASEFSFVLAAFAAGAGLVGGEIVALIAAVGIATIGISALLIQLDERIYDRLRDAGMLRPFRARGGRPSAPAPRWSDHVIVVGMNALGRRVVHGLHRRGETVLAVDIDPAKLDGLPSATLQGNVEHHSVLMAAGLPRAKLLVSALQIEDANHLLAYRTRHYGVPSSIHAFDTSLVDELTDLGASHLIVSKRDGIRQVADEIRAEGLLR
ncbi:MAG: cation:proton antiporter [Gemmatimonadota bacterium]